MGSGISVERTVGGLTAGNMDVKNKWSHDVKKLTSAASRLKITSKRKADKEKEKISNKDQQQQQQKQEEAEKKVEKIEKNVEKQADPLPSKKVMIYESSRPTKSKTTADVVVASRERRWTLTDLLQCLGTYVHHQCKGLLSRPTAPEVAMWVRCADKALQLNGWTINSFLLESHVVFTYMLLQLAFEKFAVRTLTDAKELVLMCLYISYTYNANEISYPLRPFLVKQDRVAFWSKCTELSLDSSRNMLMINKDKSYYRELVCQLKSFSHMYTYH